MARSRREFLKDGAVGGAALGILGLPSVTSGQTARPPAMPTPQAKALMALFGLRYPIFQGPYGGPALASAISNAGALGHVALWRRTPEGARAIVTQIRSQTKQPFVVNYVLSFEPRSLPAALDAGAPVVQFSWGLPTKDVVTAVRQASSKFGVQVGTAQGAQMAVDLGADYLVAQGNEAGGHVQSSTPLYELLPKVLEAATGIPVLVAGGVSHGANLRAALVAGASGAVVGTRFVATLESDAHTGYKAALVRAEAKDTAVSVCFQDGWPGATHRTLRNDTLERWEAAGCPPVGMRPGEGDIVATGSDGVTAVRYSILPPQQGFQGTLTDLAMYAGQGVGDVRDIPTARQLVERLWAECLAARP
jgi:nitronate monooxygenase